MPWGYPIDSLSFNTIEVELCCYRQHITLLNRVL